LVIFNICLGTDSVDFSKNSDLHFTGKYMNEDIEMMSKEIEQIRDQILKKSPIKTTPRADLEEVSPLIDKELLNECAPKTHRSKQPIIERMSALNSDNSTDKEEESA